MERWKQITTLPSGVSSVREEERSYFVGRREGDGAHPFETWDEYKQSNLFLFTTRMRVYSVAGHEPVDIAVPIHSEVHLPLADALKCLLAVPDTTLVRRLTLLDQRHPYEDWQRQVKSAPEAVVSSDILADAREIVLYQPALSMNPCEPIFYQWNNLLRAATPEAARAFDLVGNLERPWPEVRPWGQFGMHLVALAGGRGPAPHFAVANPIRATIWGTALASRLAQVAPEERSPRHDAYQHLADSIDAAVKPTAIVRLETFAEKDDWEKANRARQILSYLR